MNLIVEMSEWRQEEELSKQTKFMFVSFYLSSNLNIQAIVNNYNRNCCLLFSSATKLTTEFFKYTYYRQVII